MSKRHVNWSDSPTGGSHRRNDSGVGPFSDSDSPKSSNDYDDPYNTIKRLQEAFLKVSEQKEKYKKKAEELDFDLTKVKAERDQVKKDLVEKEAQWRGVMERNELLDSDNKTLKKENKTLQEENERLEKELRRAKRDSNSPPASMTGALEASSDDKTIRRSSSQRKSRRGSVSHTKDFDRALRRQQEEEEREKERERQEREQEMRLRRRMGNSPGDESDANNSKSSSGSRKSHSSRTSYIEPLGEPAPRPPPQIPQSPRGASSHSRGAHYPQYSTQQYAQPSYTSHRTEPVSGNVPRSIRPQVYYDGGSTVDEYNAGGYQPYPLPRR